MICTLLHLLICQQCTASRFITEWNQEREVFLLVHRMKKGKKRQSNIPQKFQQGRLGNDPHFCLNLEYAFKNGYSLGKR